MILGIVCCSFVILALALDAYLTYKSENKE
jgi:hypothetical protein